MADFQVEYDTDAETTKQTLTELMSDLGPVDWNGDRGSFKGSGIASGVKGDVSVTQVGHLTSVQFGYSLPLKLKMLGGKIEDQIRKSIEKSGGRII